MHRKTHISEKTMIKSEFGTKVCNSVPAYLEMLHCNFNVAPRATVCETSHGDYIPKKMLNVIELDNYVTTKLQYSTFTCGHSFCCLCDHNNVNLYL